MFLGIQKNSRGAEGKNKKTPDPFSLPTPFPPERYLVPFSPLRSAKCGSGARPVLCPLLK